MVKRFVAWANGDSGAKVLAIGPWAKKDFLRMGVRAEKIVDWGYFVAPSRFGTQVSAAHAELDETCMSTPRPVVGRHDSVLSSCDPHTIRVLWVGRDLAWKRVNDIERAVAFANDELRSGVEERKVIFTKLMGVPMAAVRAAMQMHDVYVLASNAEEGWGAALNEALEEGMSAIGTFEAGASAAMLPKERLYHAGDVKALARLLVKEYNNKLPQCGIGRWTAKVAAERLLSL